MFHCPEIDAALEKEGAPTASTLLEFIGLLEHYSTATLRRHRSTQEKLVPGHNRRATAVESFWNQVLIKSPADEGLTALVDPPSVPETSSHRGSFSGRSGGSSTSSDADRRKIKNLKGKVGVRHSVASSDMSNDVSKVLDLGVLSQRAQKAVATRLADATTVTITSQKGERNQHK